jgi:hypothetical protein
MRAAGGCRSAVALREENGTFGQDFFFEKRF